MALITWSLQVIAGGVSTGSAQIGQSQTLAAWGIDDVKISRRSHAVDTLTFTVTSAAFDAPELFGYLSLIALYRNGVQWFYGYVTKIPREGTADMEEMRYECSGPWFALTQVVFQQQWFSTNGVTSTLIPTNRSRVIFGNSVSGTKMNLGQVLSQAYAWCLSSYASANQPAPFQIGQTTPTLTIPYSEITDRSCEEIVQLCLRWLPDAVTWFDYTTNPPTLNTVQRSGLGATTLSCKARAPFFVTSAGNGSLCTFF